MRSEPNGGDVAPPRTMSGLLRLFACELNIQLLVALGGAPMGIAALARSVHLDAADVSPLVRLLRDAGLICVIVANREHVYRLRSCARVTRTRTAVRLKLVAQDGSRVTLMQPLAPTVVTRSSSESAPQPRV